jgi:uncharacterized protein
MIIHRDLAPLIQEMSTQFPVVAILGPRQSGKTTLAQLLFPNHAYISLEDFDMRTIAQEDPRRFLKDYPNTYGIILDEIHYAPQILSYIQTIVDREKKYGYFIVTGSQNFLVNEAITQSLAGRIAITTLFPLSMNELVAANLVPDRLETVVLKGTYPRIYADSIPPLRLYTSYMRTYLERDVRQLRNILNLGLFKRFISLCVYRTGQLVNYASLANDCGIDEKTVRAWLALLEASYIIFLVQPYYKRFGKRVIKSPKLYFVDTGLACSLLRIKSVEELRDHPMRGPLVETFVIADLIKQQSNLERTPSIYFWRDQAGHEIDYILEESPEPIAIEVKASKTVIPDYFKELNYWRQLTDFQRSPSYVIYGGSTNQSWPGGQVISWQHMGHLVKDIS